VSTLTSGCVTGNHNLFPHCRPRYPQRDAIHPRPVQSLPPLRAFLRDEGIDTEIEPRQPCLIGATHEVAREEARRRALRAAATRYGFVETHLNPVSLPLPSCHARVGPVLGYEHRNGASVDGQSTVRALDEGCRMGHNRRLALISSVLCSSEREPQELLQRTVVTLPESR
jgi:hypothetical protein